MCKLFGLFSDMMGEQYQVETFVINKLATQMRVARVVFGCEIMLCYVHIGTAIRKNICIIKHPWPQTLRKAGTYSTVWPDWTAPYSRLLVHDITSTDSDMSCNCCTARTYKLGNKPIAINCLLSCGPLVTRNALQIDVDAAKQWSLDWHLPLNDEKFVHMSFGGDSANSFVMHVLILSHITRTDFQILYGAYVRPLLEYANPVVYSGRTKDVTLIERVQRAVTKIVAGLKSVDYETRLAPPGVSSPPSGLNSYALFEQGLVNRFFTVDPANTRRGHGGRQLLNDKNKTNPGNLAESLDPVYQSVNP
ncbi:hypothetical protein CLF_104269 [Clonorchis sinensis]|uniref:Uncharacterized protein n=1 Tax=Clonorchis sinensis TaxID=79923 RepID=G7YBA2_CLOSI|nr:hypothetical protein CLF_104269 [Clonorchis sinensis]